MILYWMSLKLHNSLSGKTEEFKPLDEEKGVRMYVCGPTVYDRPHIGNARAVVVYDVLFRILRDIYGEDKVIYARNITDVDDKINKAAIERGISIQELTKEITDLFHSDMEALNNLPPTLEPKATENIDEIIKMIERIIKNGYGYEAKGHVLFDVKAFEEIRDEEEPFCCSDPSHNHDKDFENEYYYGKLSGKKLEDLVAGARVEVESYKKNPEDFVLWKPADDEDDESSKFESPWGVGRPGWHIECSAMSTKHLGKNFDIHGGGADLKFPHHENEIAQGLGASPSSHYANFWVHNGFVTVNGEKMSKSLGNFTTVKELLEKGVHGEVIRLALLSTHYRKPLDFNKKLLEDSKKTLDKFYGILKTLEENKNIESPEDKNVEESIGKRSEEAFNNLLQALHDDMNTPLAISHLYTIAKGLRSVNADKKSLEFFKKGCWLLGICQTSVEDWFSHGKDDMDQGKVKELIEAHKKARAEKDWKNADKIRDELTELGAYPYD